MELRTCNYCHKSAELACQRCRDSYCSRECQHADWPQHKLFCFPMPSLVKSSNEVTSSKSDPRPVTILTSTSKPPSGPVSPSTKLQNMKLDSECDKSSKNVSVNRPLIGANKEHVQTILSDSTKAGGIVSGNISSADKGSTHDKPPYVKTNGYNVASIRKPGTLSQVVPPSKQVKVEPSEQKTVVEPPKLQPTVQPPKLQPTVQPASQQKQVNVTEQKSVEPKQTAAPIPLIPKKIEQPLPSVTKPTPEESDRSAKQMTQASKTVGAWMKPFPIENENEFVDVIVQYIAPDGTVWVSMSKLDNDNNNLLRMINKTISTASTPTAADVTVNSLFLVPFEEIYYRGVILQPISAKNTVSVRLVDFGNDVTDLPIDELKSPLPAIAEKNAFAFPIRFKNSRQVEIGNSIQIKKVSIDDGDIMTVLVDRDETVAPTVTATVAPAVAPAPTPSMLTKKDIDVVPIPIGNNIDLVCLDYSNLPSGYVSTCVLDAKAVKFVDDMGQKMSKHCNELKDNEYHPQVDELCLARFDDNEWYRAVTLKVIDANQFQIMFIDYGNIITVNSSAIRKMIDDFTHPCLMNMCYIKGFPKAPSKENVHKAAVYFDAHQTFNAEKVEKTADDKYVIHVSI